MSNVTHLPHGDPELDRKRQIVRRLQDEIAAAEESFWMRQVAIFAEELVAAVGRVEASEGSQDARRNLNSVLSGIDNLRCNDPRSFRQDNDGDCPIPF